MYPRQGLTGKREGPRAEGAPLHSFQTFSLSLRGVIVVCGTIVIPRIYLIDPNSVGDAFSVLAAFYPELPVQAVLLF